MMHQDNNVSKVGVVGIGYWGPNLVRNLFESRRAQVRMCCDLEPEKLVRVKKRYPEIETTQDFEALLNSDLDAIFVATPVSTHYPLARAALENGKHVFVEKPFVSSSKDGLELCHLADKNHLKIMVGHTFEYSPPVNKIKTLISHNELGRIYYISSSRVNLGLHQSDVSVIWDLAPHDFSILFYLINETPLFISAIGKDYVQPGIPDVAFINVGFPSGIIAHIEVSWLSPSKLRRTTIIGDKKMLVYDDTSSMEKIKIYDKGVDYKDPETFGEFQLSYRTGDIISPQLKNYEPLRVEIDHFLDCVQNGNNPGTDGYKGLQVVRAMEMAEESLNNSGQIIYVSSDSLLMAHFPAT
jgi:predicted dehydrogenase